MTILEIVMLLICLAFLAIAAYTVPLLVQIRKTAARAEETLCGINQKLPLIVQNLEEITANMNKVAARAGQQVDDLSLTVEKINSAVNFYLEKELYFRQQVSIPIADTFRNYGALVKGIRAFVDTLKNKRGR
jgi:uncharacterized protein YoxC